MSLGASEPLWFEAVNIPLGGVGFGVRIRFSQGNACQAFSAFWYAMFEAAPSGRRRRRDTGGRLPPVFEARGPESVLLPPGPGRLA